MSVFSYFSPRFPPMRVVWEGSAPTWMVFTETSSVSDERTLGALAGALRVRMRARTPLRWQLRRDPLLVHAASLLPLWQ
jgi:hypothetical protein